MAELSSIPINQIRENQVSLRTVNRESEKYLGLIDSIKLMGVLNPINVRFKRQQINNPDGSITDDEYYELVDGLQRFSASKDAGLKEIPAQVVDLQDNEVLEAQIMANIHREETKPIEYTNQLKRILNLNPTMTLSQLAARLGKSEKWVDDRLSIVKIEDENIRSLIDNGDVNLVNAYHLAKLPSSEQKNYLDAAIREPSAKFTPMINARIKELREAKAQGRKAADVQFSPVAYIQKVSDIKNEREHLDTITGLLIKNNITDIYEAAKMTLSWVLHLDPDSVEVQKQKDEEAKAPNREAVMQRKAAAAAKNAEKKRAQAEEAALAAERIANELKEKLAES